MSVKKSRARKRTWRVSYVSTNEDLYHVWRSMKETQRNRRSNWTPKDPPYLQIPQNMKSRSKSLRTLLPLSVKPSRNVVRVALFASFLLPWSLLPRNVRADGYEGGRIVHIIYVNEAYYDSDSCDGFWHLHQGTAPNGTYPMTFPPGSENYFVTCEDGVCSPDTLHYASVQNEDLSHGRTFNINVNGYQFSSVFGSAAVQYSIHGPAKTVRPPPVDVFVTGLGPIISVTMISRVAMRIAGMARIVPEWRGTAFIPCLLV